MIKPHIYENRTATPITVILPTEDNQTASELTFGPWGRVELTYPGLDGYVPHRLTKVCLTTGLINQIVTEVAVVEETPASAEPITAPVVVEPVTEEVIVNEEPIAEAPAEEAPVVEQKPVAKKGKK